jgi:hypothetical protein
MWLCGDQHIQRRRNDARTAKWAAAGIDIAANELLDLLVGGSFSSTMVGTIRLTIARWLLTTAQDPH